MATSPELAHRSRSHPAAPAAAAADPGRGGAVWFVVGAVVLLLGLAGLAARGTGYAYGPPAPPQPGIPVSPPPDDAKALKQAERKLEQRQRQLLAAIERRKPKGTYIVIDQTQNRLYLMKDEQVLREVVCSAGSGMVLQESAGGRKWIFDTPRGVFKVQSKIDDPVWRKPDWAFVEEGKPIPKDPSERFDPGVLGEFALYFGHGYMIHGTLYERLLGRSVTHGCIRLGRDDLREVNRAAPIGTPIYIY